MNGDTTTGADTDRALAARIVSGGDEAAFNVLYERHTPALYSLVFRLMAGMQAEAEDVIQDTWIRAVAALPRFRWESEFRSWLIGIGLNRSREVLRRRERRARLLGWFHPEPKPQAPPSGERVDIERAMHGLPEGGRLVLILHDVEGYTHEEIGAQLGIAVGTSRSRLFHARRTMKGLLGSNQEEA